MIKILFFIEKLYGGGAEKALCNLVNAMDQSIFDITVPGIISVLDDVFHNTGFSENDDDFMVEIIRPLY